MLSAYRILHKERLFTILNTTPIDIKGFYKKLWRLQLLTKIKSHDLALDMELSPHYLDSS